MFRQIGPGEIIVILGIVVLLFGAKRLPELARGSGRALRIFKSEIKGLQDDDEARPPESPAEPTRSTARREVTDEPRDTPPDRD